MGKFVRNISILLIICGATHTPAHIQKESLQNIAKSSVEAYGLPAVGISWVGMSGSGLAVSGVRAVGRAERVRDSDLWHLGSITKSFTSLLIAFLVDEGMLSWETTVGDILASEKVAPDYKSLPITRLLTHTAGIDDQVVDGNPEVKMWVKRKELGLKESRYEVGELVFSTSPTGEVGRYQYSNYGTTLAAMIAERATGLSWEALIQRYVFQKLGLRGCVVAPKLESSNGDPTYPWGHFKNKSGQLVASPGGSYRAVDKFFSPAGTINCPLADVNSYLKFQLSALKGNQPLLSSKSKMMLFKDLYDVSYTPGSISVQARQDGSKFFHHNGTNTFNYAQFVILPEKEQAIFMATNLGNDLSADKPRARLENIVLDIIVRIIGTIEAL